MSVEKEKLNLAYGLASMLRGTVAPNNMAYVCAEVAFVLSEMSGRFIPTEAEFRDLINGLDCSFELKNDLMRDLVPLWNEIFRMQGRHDKRTLERAILDCARHSDLENITVPASIIPLITKLLSSEPGGVMADMACGRGTVLAQALEEDDDLRGDAIEVNAHNANFTEMAIAPYRDRAKVCRASAFDFMADHMWQYDKVFCYPPFGMRFDRMFQLESFKRMLPAAFANVGVGCRSELIFALTAVATMKEGGRAVVLLPEGALFNQMASAVAAREYLLNSGYLDCVISLPGHLLERTQIDVSLLVFALKKKREDVTFVDASGLGEKGRRFSTLSEENVERIVNAAYGFRNDETWSAAHCRKVACSEIRGSGYDLSARHYFEKAALPAFDNSVRLGDVVESIERGAAIASRDMDDLVAHGKGVCYYLSPSTIENGAIANDLPEMKEVPRKTPKLEPGDIILMRTGANSKIVVFEGDLDKPVVLSSNLFVCRLAKDKIDPWYLKAFLESEDGRTLLSSIAIGAVIKSISVKSLENLQVPLPPMKEQRIIAKAFRQKFRRMLELKRELAEVCQEMTRVFGAER